MATDLMTVLGERFVAAIRSVLGDDAPGEVDAMLAAAKNPEHGDFQSNAAMPLAKVAGRKPRELAEAVVGALDVSDIAEEPTVAGPGFINVRLKAGAIAGALGEMDAGDAGLALGVERVGEGETIVVDLCGVNLAKEMHVGHLRSTVIGDALARMHERLGYRVVRQNHFGDWGLPIAMVVHLVMEKVGAGELEESGLSVEVLERLYREAKVRGDLGRVEGRVIAKYRLGPKVEAEFEDDVAAGEAFRAACAGTLVKLQSGDAETVRVWELVSRVTLDACFEVCATLQADVTDEHTAGESSYREELPGLVEDLVGRGVAEESDGALVVRLDDVGIKEPCLVRKRDGGFLYATTDLAAIRRRVHEMGADRVIYAVDSRQGLHFRQVFAAAEKAGYATRDGKVAGLMHAAFGTVLGPDGKALKSRSGENVKLSALLAEGITRARAAVAEKNPELSSEEADAVAADVGIGAIKYADLSSDRIKDYTFDFDRMLGFEGNTGPYLQYAHVRVRSIFRKAAEMGVEVGGGGFVVSEAEERALALHLLRYASVVRGSAEACEPHRLCVYLFELAQLFSSFFTACPVLKAADEGVRGSRLRLCGLVGRVLADGLHDLGIAAPERM